MGYIGKPLSSWSMKSDEEVEVMIRQEECETRGMCQDVLVFFRFSPFLPQQFNLFGRCKSVFFRRK